MYGITGSLDFGANATSRSALEAMTNSLAHRGPDGSGVARSARAGRAYLQSQLEADGTPIFDHLREDAVGLVVREHMEGAHDRGQQLFCLLTLSTWLRTF